MLNSFRMNSVVIIIMFDLQREEELIMIEQQINPALDNNAHVSAHMIMSYDVTSCICRLHYLTG